MIQAADLARIAIENQRRHVNGTPEGGSGQFRQIIGRRRTRLSPSDQTVVGFHTHDHGFEQGAALVRNVPRKICSGIQRNRIECDPADFHGACPERAVTGEMIYIEFIEREAGTPIEVFRHLGNQQSAWSEVATDRMILQVGRTLRLGPKPSYLCLWEIPDIGRLDAWEEYFNSGAAAENRRSQAMHRAISIQRAGLYDVLWQAKTLEASLYLILYCEPGGLTNEALINVYQTIDHEFAAPAAAPCRESRARSTCVGYLGRPKLCRAGATDPRCRSSDLERGRSGYLSSLWY